MKHFKIRQAITDRSSNAVNLYLKDIKKYPLLTDEEEKLLFADLNKENREKIIQSNLRFVVSIAKQYQGKGIELADLIAVGNTGLMQAVDKFDVTMGCRFISYAVWWIRQAMLEEIMTNGKTIRVPINKIASNIKLTKAITEFEQQYGTIPTEDELLQIMNVDDEELQKILQGNIVVINDTVVNENGEEESVFDSLVLDDYPPDDIKDDIKVSVHAALQELNPVEQLVIKELFGFDTEPKEVEVVAENLQLTTERVRQIKDKAIIKLRKSNNIQVLTKYLG